MQIKLSREQLLKNLSMANDVVSSKNAMSVLSNVLLKAKGNTLMLSATDTESYIQITDQAEVTSEGSIALSSKNLMEIVKNMPKDDVSIKLDEKSVAHISTDSKTTKVKFKLHGIQETGYVTFPDIPDIKAEEIMANIKIPVAADLKKIFYKTLPFTSSDYTQNNMSGVCFNVLKDKIFAVATDTRKLSYAESKNLGSDKDEPSVCIVPEKVANLFVRIFPDDSELNVTISRSLIFFYNDKIKLSSRLIDGSFPDYKRAVPEKFDKNAVVSLSKFSEAVKRVSSIMDTTCLKIVLTFKGKELNLLAENNEVGNAEETIELESSDFQDFEIHYSWQVLQDSIKIMTKPNIQFGFNSANAVGRMKEEGQDSSFAILAPLK